MLEGEGGRKVGGREGREGGREGREDENTKGEGKKEGYKKLCCSLQKGFLAWDAGPIHINALTTLYLLSHFAITQFLVTLSPPTLLPTPHSSLSLSRRLPPSPGQDEEHQAKPGVGVEAESQFSGRVQLRDVLVGSAHPHHCCVGHLDTDVYISMVTDALYTVCF